MLGGLKRNQKSVCPEGTKGCTRDFEWEVVKIGTSEEIGQRDEIFSPGVVFGKKDRCGRRGAQKKDHAGKSWTVPVFHCAWRDSVRNLLCDPLPDLCEINYFIYG